MVSSDVQEQGSVVGLAAPKTPSPPACQGSREVAGPLPSRDAAGKVLSAGSQQESDACGRRRGSLCPQVTMVADRALTAGEGLNFNQPDSNPSLERQAPAVLKRSLSKEDEELLGGMWVRTRRRCFSIFLSQPAGMLPSRTAGASGRISTPFCLRGCILVQSILGEWLCSWVLSFLSLEAAGPWWMTPISWSKSLPNSFSVFVSH